MKQYTIQFDEDAIADLQDLPKKAQRQLLKAVEKLAQNPHQGNVKQLKGHKDLFRLRSGDYRIIYTLEEAVLVVLVIAVGHRKNIYEVLKRRTD